MALKGRQKGKRCWEKNNEENGERSEVGTETKAAEPSAGQCPHFYIKTKAPLI